MVTKKRASKKTPKRKTTAARKKATRRKKAKAAAKQSPKRIQTELFFIRVDGQPISSLRDLARQLDDMSDEIFFHHVTPDKNDFATWVVDVFGEESLAERIGHIKDRRSICYEVMKHLLQ
ncbi:MAG: hypothetical protein ACOCWQ_00125 [Nanoarchaeota archaeon]